MSTDTSDEDRRTPPPKVMGSSGVQGSSGLEVGKTPSDSVSSWLRQPDGQQGENETINLNSDTTPITGHVAQRLFTGANPAATHRYITAIYPEASGSSIGSAEEPPPPPPPPAITHPWGITFSLDEEPYTMDIIDGQIFDDKLSVTSLLTEDNTLGRSVLDDYEYEVGHVWVLKYDFSLTRAGGDGPPLFRYAYFASIDDYVPDNGDLDADPVVPATINYYPLGIIQSREDDNGDPEPYAQQIATTNLCTVDVCFNGRTAKSLTPV